MTEAYIPRPYQTLITNYIVDNPRCCVWAGMGLGKTAATLQAMDILNLEEVMPPLIIAPLRVARTVWSDEVEKWSCFAGRKVSKIIGDSFERTSALAKSADLYTVNFEQLIWLTSYLGDKWPFKRVIVDEGSKLRGFRLRQGAKRAHALGKIAHTKIDRLVELSGTPGDLEALWGQLWFIDQGKRLGKTFTAFSNRWFRLDYSGFGLIPYQHAQDEIQQLISDVCFSLKAEDYFDLKEPIVNKIYVDLPHKAMRLYKDMENKFYAEISGKPIEAVNAAVKSGKCLQIANGAAYTEEGGEKYEIIHEEKIAALESVVEEAAGMPVLVVYNFKSDLDRLRRAFKHGKVLDQQEKTIKDWNKGKIPLLFVHPASAGHGLSLQHGSNIIAFFGMNWNSEEHEQVIQRIGPVRQLQAGYNRPVFIHYILSRGTIDELVLERLMTKRSIQDILLETMKIR